MSGALRKDVAPRPAGRRNIPAWDIQADDDKPAVRVTVPALTRLAKDSATVITRAADTGMLGDVAREIAQIEKAHAASAADLPGKAARWEQLAAVTADPAQAAHYRQMAAGAREQLAHAGDHLSKARRYEEQAGRVTSPADRQGYLELARREREKAGI